MAFSMTEMVFSDTLCPMQQKRILITGNAGSGKTILSHKVAKRNQIPRHGLDSIVWQSGWRKTPDEEKRKKIQNLIEGDSWVIDGVSSQVFRAAQEVYFLDLPLSRSILNIFRRFLQNGMRTREDLPDGCPEIIGVFKAIKVAFRYQKQTRPLILNLISSHSGKKIHWIKSYQELLRL